MYPKGFWNAIIKFPKLCHHTDIPTMLYQLWWVDGTNSHDDDDDDDDDAVDDDDDYDDIDD